MKKWDNSSVLTGKDFLLNVMLDGMAWRLVIVRVLCVLVVINASACGSVTISSRAGADVSIVSNGYEKQAQSLGKYLNDMTGTDIPIIPKASDNQQSAIVLDVADSIAGTSNTPTGEQAYRIHTDGNRIYLTGRSEMGLTYAVYGFLEDHLGVRFYSRDCEIVPKQRTLKINKIDDTQEPAFVFRGFIWNTEGKDHERKNRGRGVPDTRATHNFYGYIPPAKYFREHPEWFGLIAGKRTHNAMMPLCFTNKELADELASRLMEKMAEWDSPEIPIAVGQGDGFNACQCQVCRNVVEQEQSEASPMILMLNRVLEKTTKQYPDHKIITFAYFETLKVPKSIRPHPNLWINVVSSALNQGPAGDQLGRIRNNPRNKDYADAIRGWPEIAPGRVVLWEWTQHFVQPLMEWPNIFDVADNIRFFAENDIAAIKLQVVLGNGNWSRLRRWLWLKMMWNPNSDVEKLTKQFLGDYYGSKAAGSLWEYLEYVHNVADESGYQASVCRGQAYIENIYKNVFTDEKLRRMDELITAAEKAAAKESNPVFSERVGRVRPTTIDMYQLHRAGVLAKVEDRRDGSMWFVPGAVTDMPARIERVAQACLSVWASRGWYYRYRFLREHGGRITGIENDRLRCEIVPDMHSKIISLVHKPTGKELVLCKEVPDMHTKSSTSVGGYEDIIEGSVAQQWSVTQADSNRISLKADLQFNVWEHYTNMRLDRDIILDGQKPRLIIKRYYCSMKGKKYIPDSLRFLSRWSFVVGEPEKARVSINGGGITTTLPVKDLEKITFDVDQEQGDLNIKLERGDSMVVELGVESKGFNQLTLERDAKQAEVSVLLRGIPYSTQADTFDINLPTMTIDVKSHLED